MAAGGFTQVEDVEEEQEEEEDEDEVDEEEDKKNLKKMLDTNGKNVEIDESLFNVDDLQDLDEELEKLEV